MEQAQNGESSVPEVASEVQVENMPISFSVGETFLAFEQLEAKIKSYEEQNYVKFWKRDCRTIEAARKRINWSLRTSSTTRSPISGVARIISLVGHRVSGGQLP